MSLEQPLQRTAEKWTIGLVNLPLLRDNRGEVQYKINKAGNRVKAMDPLFRYPFFELDYPELEAMGINRFDALDEVFNSYVKRHLSFWSHRSMRGAHFICVKAIPKEEFWIMMKELKHLNPKWPMITLRIKPNKYVGEKERFKEGVIISETYDQELENIKTWVLRQHIGLINLHYKMVRYRFDTPAKEVKTQ